MKQNNETRFPHLILLIAILSSTCQIFLFTKGIFYDTASYVSAWDRIISGHLDILRTPVYPIILGLTKSVLGQEIMPAFISLLQNVIFVVASIYFYKLMVKVTQRKKWAQTITIVFILYQWISPYTNVLLTESLSLSGGIFMLYFAYKMYENPSIKDSITFAFWTLFLIFLRPSFIYLLPVSLLSWVLLAFKKKKKSAIMGISASLICLLCVFSYMFLFQKEYGIFHLSSVSAVNQYTIARHNGIIEADNVENEKMIVSIDSCKKKYYEPAEEYDVVCNVYYGEAIKLISNYGLKEVDNIVKYSSRKHIGKIINDIAKRYFESSFKSIKFVFFRENRSHASYDFFILMVETLGFAIHLHTVYFLIFLSTFIILFYLITKKRIPWFFSFLYMLGTSNIIVMLIGAPNEFGRLIYPSLAIYLMMITLLLERIYERLVTLRKEDVKMENSN